METRRTAAFLVVLVTFAISVGCGGGTSSNSPLTTVAPTAGDQPSTGSSTPPAVDPTGSTAGTAAGGSTAGSSALADSSVLLTDEEAAVYFGVPAKHVGPSSEGAFTNFTFSPVDGTGQGIIITTWVIGSLETFESQVKAEAQALNETARRVDGIGESAYYSAGTLKFYKSGGYYQVTATDPKNGQDLMTALAGLARRMALRVP